MALHPAILHADLDSFYASVEQRDDPKLRGIPMAVGGGVILAASYEAKRQGVRTPMSERAARRLCPGLVIVPARMHAYSEASRAVFAIFAETSPLVEGLSIDEAFLDVSGLGKVSGQPLEIARRLRTRVAEEVGLPISVGLASTKHLAKVASAVSKPDGLLEVPPGTELDFLGPLPVERLWGVGPVTTRRLHQHGLFTVADLAAQEETALVSLVGKAAGHHLSSLAHNRDPRPVVVGRRRRSIGSQRSFPSGGMQRSDAEAVLLEVSDRVSSRLRSGGRVGKTVTLRLRFGDFTQASRSRTLSQATSTTDVIHSCVRLLLGDAWPHIEQRGLTRVGLSVSGLGPDRAMQLMLPFGGTQRTDLDAAVDDVRDRFGRDAIGRAALVGKISPDVPLLPEHP